MVADLDICISRFPSTNAMTVQVYVFDYLKKSVLNRIRVLLFFSRPIKPCRPFEHQRIVSDDKFGRQDWYRCVAIFFTA